MPVLVDNDVNTLAVSERLYGRGRDVDHFITVTIGRGVGLGIVAGGDIYHGAGGGAGEFGHVWAVEGGELCSCGKRGCLETVVSDPALVAQARAAGVLSKRQGIARLRALADSGDENAIAIFGHAGVRARTIGRRSRERAEPGARSRQRRRDTGVGPHGGLVRERLPSSTCSRRLLTSRSRSTRGMT